MSSSIGVIGMGVMGRNITRNFASHGIRASAYNRKAERLQALLSEAGPEIENIEVYRELPAFAASLEKPRRVLLMVTAGAAVDAVVEELLPLLEKGDIIIDGGNSFFQDTRRRERELGEKGLRFLGMGISGGERGAREGAAMMPGGDKEAYIHLQHILEAAAAKTPSGLPCCAYVGPDGAGHFVKMVHNGIEYADIQLIGDCYQLMRKVAGLSPAEIGDVFARWNEGRLRSYLVEITAAILHTSDPETGRPMVDVILDRAGQKGTGNWTSVEALKLGVPCFSIADSVFCRYLSALKEERVEASRIYEEGERKPLADVTAFIEQLEEAMYAAKICCYAQGFALLAAASGEYDWSLDLGKIALNWRAGCIIRADFLDAIAEAYEGAPPANLLVADVFVEGIRNALPAWRKSAATAIENGVAAPLLCGTLAYFDGYRSADGPASLLQAQRDFFGAHGYERVDRPGSFHTQWE